MLSASASARSGTTLSAGAAGIEITKQAPPPIGLLDPQVAVLAPDQVPGDGEADPAPGRGVRIDAETPLEHEVPVLGIDAGTVVGDPDRDLVEFVLDSRRTPGRRARTWPRSRAARGRPGPLRPRGPLRYRSRRRRNR